ncbi:MAG: hypothetical protein ACYDFU_01795 [Nitrospirota bacterium]
MSEEKFTAIEKYLSEKFPNREISQKEDNDTFEKIFRVIIERGSFLLKIERKFFDDNDSLVIIRRFNECEVPKLLAEHSNNAVRVDRDGCHIVPR